MTTKNVKVIHRVTLCLACIITLLFLFNSFFSSGFNLLLGDRFDAMIQTNLLQHWYNVFKGDASWDTVSYFYPYRNTLGYNDGYFIYGIIYSLFRLIGFELFIATDLVNITLKIISFFSFYALARQVLRLSFLSSLTGTIAFTLGNALIVQMLHAQLLSIAFAPLLAIFIIRYVIALKENQDDSVLVNGCTASVLLALWLFTSFYMAWYFIFFFIVAGAIFLVICLSEKHLRQEIKIRFKLKSFAIPVFVLLIFLIPFLKVYLPKAMETGGQTLSAVEFYAPKLFNVLDPGSSNLFFGKVADYLLQSKSVSERTGEFNVGFAPLSIIVLCATMLFLVFSKDKTIRSRFFLTLCLATLISIILVVKQGDFFLWKYVWHYFPGAKGMRVTTRLCLFLIFPVCLITAYALHRIQQTKYRSLLPLICVLMVGEQLNVYANAGFNRASQKAFLASVPPPPAACKAFYVIGQRKNEFPVSSEEIVYSLYPHNVDAMLISEAYHLRTINGFSTFNPPDWDFAKEPRSTYMARVQKYINQHHIKSDMCEFDLENLTWTWFAEKQPLGITSKLINKIDVRVLSVSAAPLAGEPSAITVEITNRSTRGVGDTTWHPLKLGVKRYAANGKLLDHDYVHLDIPTLAAQGGKAMMKIVLKEKLAKGDYVTLIPLEEGVAWFDWAGFKPVIVKID